jgi:hypothetical protein
MPCCNEYGCKRKNPVLIRQGPFSDRWYAGTSYTEKDGSVVRISDGGKHDITDQMRHWLDQAYKAGFRDGQAA